MQHDLQSPFPQHQVLRRVLCLSTSIACTAHDESAVSASRSPGLDRWICPLTEQGPVVRPHLTFAAYRVFPTFSTHLATAVIRLLLVFLSLDICIRAQSHPCAPPVTRTFASCRVYVCQTLTFPRDGAKAQSTIRKGFKVARSARSSAHTPPKWQHKAPSKAATSMQASVPARHRQAQSIAIPCPYVCFRLLPLWRP